jgi:GTP-binding protein
MRFVDEAVITARSGKGGAGCVSFRREKFVPLGGPDGGDGGKGGDMAFRASDNLLTLYDLRLKRIYEAKNGQGGMGRQRYGAAAPDLVVEVPTGTQIYEIAEDETETLAADLVRDGQVWIACQGGRGGKGNMHFASATMRAPRFAQPGEPGQEKRLRLELKVLADVGIIGLPNAGKSTLIAAVSHAKPKIAPYPFTTLAPNLGVIEDAEGRRIVMADIPGLIEGAHLGQGLGHRFLKHVERTKALLHLMSVEDVNLEDPMAGFAVVDEELARFDPELAKRTQIRVLNKIDLLDAPTLAALRAAVPPGTLLVSAKEGVGLDELLAAMSCMVYPEGLEE